MFQNIMNGFEKKNTQTEDVKLYKIEEMKILVKNIE